MTSRPGGAEETDHSQWPASLSEWAATTDMGSYFLLTHVTSRHKLSFGAESRLSNTNIVTTVMCHDPSTLLYSSQAPLDALLC